MLSTGRYSKYAFGDSVTVHTTKRVPKNSAMAKATEANRKVNKINKGIEYKYCDTINIVGLGDPIAVSYNGTIPKYLNNTATGVTDLAQRTGDKISCTFIEARFKLYNTLNFAASTPNPLVRVMIIWDYADTITSVSDLIDFDAVGTVEAVTSPIPHDKSSKFRVLFDKTTSVSYQQHQKFFSFKKKLPNITSQYLANGTSPIKGVLKFFCISDTAEPVEGYGPYLNFWSRVHYNDL